jgi:hypothetical protein
MNGKMVLLTLVAILIGAVSRLHTSPDGQSCSAGGCSAKVKQKQILPLDDDSEEGVSKVASAYGIQPREKLY